VIDRASLDGRVAVVTGGGTGIGRATAEVLAAHGAIVVLAGRRPEPLEQTAAELGGLAVPTDVTDPGQCDRLVDTTMATYGRLDILVNNAGGSRTDPFELWSDDDWQQVLDVNAASVWLVSRRAVRPMLEQGKGSIVNISSGAGSSPMPSAPPYAASKAAVNSLTATLAAAWTAKGVRVNGLAVGAVRTDLALQDAERHGFDHDTIGRYNGMGRVAEPEEIAHAVHFFASDASSFCSGATLAINGGPKG
jgi:NAD(P)-dependent dehydrogenase (short-subunit alcohol dehydrogenase family)